MEKANNEFRKILENAYQCCRTHQSTAWILEPFLNVEGNFRGVLFAQGNSPIPGCAFAFSLEIDPTRLAELPIIRFHEAIQHPLIYPGNGMFCFPENSTNGISSRTPINTILDLLAKTFFLQKPYYTSIKYFSKTDDLPFVNIEAANLEYKDPQLFWNQLKQYGDLSVYSHESFK